MTREQMIEFIKSWVVHPVTMKPIWNKEETCEFLKELEDIGMVLKRERTIKVNSLTESGMVEPVDATITEYGWELENEKI